MFRSIYIFILLICVSFPAISQIHITEDVDWTSNQILTSSIIIDEGATLTIHEGVKVQALFVDLDANEYGDIKIEVLGKINILGTLVNPVIFEPYETTESRRYWGGIYINSPNFVNDSLKHFHISNAPVGLTINTASTVHGAIVRNIENHGILVQSGDASSPISANLYDVDISNSDSTGIHIGFANVNINWTRVDSCYSSGLYAMASTITIKNSIFAKNRLGISGCSNDWDIEGTVFEENARWGLLQSAGNLSLNESEVVNNGFDGVLIANGSADISNCSIKFNQGSGIQLTDQAPYPHDEWSGSCGGSGLSSSISINNCNIFENANTQIVVSSDDLGWGEPNLFACASISNWGDEVYLYGPVEYPVGWMSAVTANVAPGNSSVNVSYKFLDAFSDAEICQIPAPVQSNYNCIEVGPVPVQESTDAYYIQLITTNVGGLSTPGAYDPVLVNYTLGGYEIFTSINDSTISDFSNNYWGSIAGVDTLIHLTEPPNIDYSNWRVSEVAGASSPINEPIEIMIEYPTTETSIEVNTISTIGWVSGGWIPAVNVSISTDMGVSWDYIEESILNINYYSWRNSLQTGDIIYIRVEDSQDVSNVDQVGPIFITESQIPLLDIMPDTLEFRDSTVSISLNLHNNGGGVLLWSASDNCNWISLNPDTGSTINEDSLTVIINRDGMESRNYSGIIDISSNGGNATIIVNMTVRQPQLSLETEILIYEPPTNELPLVITNDGGGFLTWDLFTNNDWISFSQSQGTTSVRDTVIVQVDRSITVGGLHNGQIVLNSIAGNALVNIIMTDLGVAPSAFSLLSPEINQTITSTLPIFVWEPASDPDLLDSVDYTLFLDTPDPGVMIIDIGMETSFQLATNLVDNTSYYWKVIASDLSGDTTENTGGYQSFTVNTSNDLPEYFELLYPVLDMMVATLQPEFLWEASSDPDDETIALRKIGKGKFSEDRTSGNNSVNMIIGYDFYLGTDAELTDAGPVEVIGTSYIPAEDLTENMVYYWAVSALDDSGGVTFSDTASFWTNSLNDLPSSFSMLAPVGMPLLGVTSLTPTFTWTQSNDVDLNDELIYRLNLGTSTWDMEEVYVGSETSWTPSEPLWDNTVYSWQVLAEDLSGAITVAGIGDSVAFAHFYTNVENDNPEPAVLLSPDSVMVLSSTPTFIWERSFDPDPFESIEYEVHWWYEGSEWDSVITEETLITISNPLTTDNQQYFWQVISMDDEGGIAHSEDYMFWVDFLSEPPGLFSLVGPEDESAGNSTRPELTWQEAIDPDPFDNIHYQVSIATDSSMSDIVYEGVAIPEIHVPETDLQNDTRYYWQVLALDDDSLQTSSEVWTFDVGYLAVDDGLAKPTEYALEQNYPNPFNPSTTLRYGIPEEASISLIIYDIRGNTVKTFTSEKKAAGWYEHLWNGLDNSGQPVSTGLYLTRMQAGDYSKTIKMVYLR